MWLLLYSGKAGWDLLISLCATVKLLPIGGNQRNRSALLSRQGFHKT